MNPLFLVFLQSQVSELGIRDRAASPCPVVGCYLIFRVQGRGRHSLRSQSTAPGLRRTSQVHSSHRHDFSNGNKPRHETTFICEISACVTVYSQTDTSQYGKQGSALSPFLLFCLLSKSVLLLLFSRFLPSGFGLPIPFTPKLCLQGENRHRARSLLYSHLQQSPATMPEILAPAPSERPGLR